MVRAAFRPSRLPLHSARGVALSLSTSSFVTLLKSPQTVCFRRRPPRQLGALGLRVVQPQMSPEPKESPPPMVHYVPYFPLLLEEGLLRRNRLWLFQSALTPLRPTARYLMSVGGHDLVSTLHSRRPAARGDVHVDSMPRHFWQSSSLAMVTSTYLANSVITSGALLPHFQSLFR